MKKYRLKQDLPNIKAGAIAEYIDDRWIADGNELNHDPSSHPFWWAEVGLSAIEQGEWTFNEYGPKIMDFYKVRIGKIPNTETFSIFNFYNLEKQGVKDSIKLQIEGNFIVFSQEVYGLEISGLGHIISPVLIEGFFKVEQSGEIEVNYFKMDKR